VFLNAACALDPNTAAGSFVIQVIAGVVGGVLLIAVVAFHRWVFAPLRWLCEKYHLRRMLVPGRRFRFVFNPQTEGTKFVTFQANGEIGEGRNNNEHRWRIRRGKIEILAGDNQVYSRFRHDHESGRLVHTNDADCRSIRGQYFESEWQSMRRG